METTQAIVPLVRARDVKVHFSISESFLARGLAGARNTVIKAVDGVSLDVLPSETVGLVGESGSGKSTFGRTTVGLLAPTSGNVEFDGSPIWDARGALQYKALRKRAQLVFQNPYSSLNPRYTVRHTIDVALGLRGISARERNSHSAELMYKVGLSVDHLERYPHQLSGGQRQRVAIARALAMEPDFIVADEPLSSLDVSVQAQIIGVLQELQRELGLSYLLIAHDLSLVYHMCSKVAVMYAGQIVELASTDDLFATPVHPYTQILLETIPGNKKGGARPFRAFAQPGTWELSVAQPKSTPLGCRFAPRCPRRKPLCDFQMPDLLPTEGCAQDFADPQAHMARCHFVVE